MSRFNGSPGIVLPRQVSLALNMMPGPLAHPVSIALPKPDGQVELGIVGGMTKLELAALHLAATVPAAEWEADPAAAARKTIERVRAIGAALEEFQKAPKEEPAPPAA